MKTIGPLVLYALLALGGGGFAWLAGAEGAEWQGLPVMFVCAALAFAINWAAAVPAILAKTEHFYDLTGALTYIAVMAAALALTGRSDPAALIAAAVVLVWCVRLGTMLFSRVRETGEDKRFRHIRNRPLSFLGAWTTQALWVVLISSPALAIIVLPAAGDPTLLFWAGLAIWALGFGIEAIADAQKGAFRRDPANRGRFITTGLWSWSQHPNYFGEILLWTGVAIMAVPILSGAAWLVFISPLFSYVLLTRVSGTPMLDKLARERWGEDPSYQAYVRRTSELVPLPPRS